MNRIYICLKGVDYMYGYLCIKQGEKQELEEFMNSIYNNPPIWFEICKNNTYYIITVKDNSFEYHEATFFLMINDIHRDSNSVLKGPYYLDIVQKETILESNFNNNVRKKIDATQKFYYLLKNRGIIVDKNN